jgi:hypothetical protein
LFARLFGRLDADCAPEHRAKCPPRVDTSEATTELLDYYGIFQLPGPFRNG